MKMTLDEHIECIYQNRDEICDSSRLARLYIGYTDIREEYEKRGVTDYFEDIFISYYRMNGPAGSSPMFRREYFSILKSLREGQEISFEEISRRLFDVDGKHQLALISKLLHTADTSSPLYDSQVASVLGTGGVGPGTLDEKIEKSRALLDETGRIYESLRENEKFSGVIKIFDDVYHRNRISYVKKCDFIIAVYGELSKKK